LPRGLCSRGIASQQPRVIVGVAAVRGAIARVAGKGTDRPLEQTDDAGVGRLLPGLLARHVRILVVRWTLETEAVARLRPHLSFFVFVPRAAPDFAGARFTLRVR
jgi:hypothetical protein